eukprot:Lithocolla_globosa_v1_NODE_7440_length_947_cov_3.727578.p2 type:complete len:115 gc:universal NODE_7440_length_947_cov_3.727578:458-114(-)
MAQAEPIILTYILQMLNMSHLPGSIRCLLRQNILEKLQRFSCYYIRMGNVYSITPILVFQNLVKHFLFTQSGFFRPTLALKILSPTGFHYLFQNVVVLAPVLSLLASFLIDFLF